MVSLLVRAARGLPVSHTPVWFMRQAGRSLPEYRRVREGVPMLQACRTPELVAEITLQPVRRHDVDAAVFFSDIVVPLAAAGIDVDIVPGTGPVVASPVRTRADVDALPDLDPAVIDDIAEAVRLTVAELGDKALVGFAGAPFTLASYLVEGGPSRNHEHTKAMMYGDPVTWNALCAKLARISTTFLRVQIEAGASAIQLFDSWVGALSRPDYERHVQQHSAAVLSGVADLEVPRIHFGVGTGELLASMGAAGADVVGVDYRISLEEANARLGGQYALQGNLDPALLFAPWEPLEAKVREILAAGAHAPGHIFNLGHGVLPSTDPDMLTRVTALVHELSAG
ncbi:uroporphyrinogen decarboxylase [Calidifontibacter sp. DB0510]|uniref:Uroporphyrinogen decarboxylase n=1 Tax=Metallococcus carri TaxID=1656884 RepID=A0A967B8T5_9MICO|nr:uroporphyrinogen decarboxylase [Metallococcus carri]NHN56921.1 uroporphyrinogen decarboxylase [Metallococcus carri]NOP37666.1 uroporphyrinogen decarboxylase [Calidifontibacter sp. DB2511S]